MNFPSNAPRLWKELYCLEGSQALTVCAAEGSVSEEDYRAMMEWYWP